MWYEIIPCLGIITGALAVPTVFNFYFHKFFLNGNAYQRDRILPFNNKLYQRDQWLNGNPYVMQGLDNIPDK